ncbi:response regulator receiver protein [Desulfotomaculum nigrificans CO-1-SRB]|uniref:Stage 0 sporulation protein A homolog n=1 Tax=Desulfotomaculum nigrificans (strain DSM 14880 / VKM B-2319 / CO-1-SRB) TaxID=868595 RepID=F6B7A1_DESCC|nr:response regulator [Desulfotomaculum nigrificans]AEF93351.1 response regulator receiver protein [Desulfotomaculum nigrificans CO-1-SRB]
MKDALDVLIVDDQVGVRYLLEILVKESGHRAHTAQNGVEAVEKVRSIKPDLVFMDVRMPIMNGLEALGKIKMIAPRTQVVMMTAYSAEDTATIALQKGALKCMSKPFDVEEIKEILENFAWNCQLYEQACLENYA